MDLLDGGSSSEDESDNQQPRVLPPPSNAKARKGKKLLSLTAILPQHIADQLMKGGDADGDDSEDEAPPKAVKQASKSTTVTTTTTTSRDPGISSLLEDLQHSKPIVTSTRKGLVGKKSSEPLGAAFLTTVTTTVVDPNDEVRDIHNEPRVETVEDQPEEDEEDSKPSFKRVSLAPVPRRVKGPTPERDRDADFTTDSRFASAPSATSAVTVATQLDGTAAGLPASKKSRQELERALRQGNFGALDSSRVEHLEQAIPSYQPQAPAAAPTHGIKVVPTAIYDPSAGGAVTGRRGKSHQINQLLAQAASLEQARAQGQVKGPTSHRANAKRKYGW